MNDIASLELATELKELSSWKYDHINSYTLGFLLRKLPESNREYDVVLRFSKTTKLWRCSLKGYDHGRAADTPEDATCKLAIELFKQGILK